MSTPPDSSPKFAPFSDADNKLAELTNWVEIGAGVSGTVWRADHLRHNRRIAVKRFHAQVSGRREVGAFVDEVRALGALDGRRGVANLFDTTTDLDGHPVLLMRFYGRGSFEKRLRQDGPLPAEEVLRLGARLAEVLEVAHSLSIFHRDVKPANVLISDEDEAVLSDFGIAAVGGRLSDTRYWASTPLHAAPEVLERGGGSAAADVWSLASTMVILLTGFAPYELDGDGPDGVPELLLRIRTGRMRALSADRVPAELAEILHRALHPDPSIRTQSAALFLEQLRSVPLLRAQSGNEANYPSSDVADKGLLQTNLSPVTGPVFGPEAGHPASRSGWAQTSLNPLEEPRHPDTAAQDERRRSRALLVAGGIAAAVVAVSAVAAILAHRHGTGSDPPHPSAARLSETRSAGPSTSVTEPRPTGVRVRQTGTTVVVTWSSPQPTSALGTVVSDGTRPEVATGQRYVATGVPVGAPRCYAVGWVYGLNGQVRYGPPVCVNRAAPVSNAPS